jgi:hypothetical protein
MWPAAPIAALAMSLGVPPLCAQELSAVQPLLSIPLNEIASRLPAQTHALFTASAIERFLSSVDGVPPDWQALYGHGHHDPSLDERLFRLNRERDVKREGREALSERIAFVWSGELSGYDHGHGGFRVALGPRFTGTSWGVVRFKYEDVSGELVAVPPPAERDILLKRKEQGPPIDIDVVMVGKLISEEPIVYDFSHDEEGTGVIMPVVRVEAIFYLRAPTR